MIFRLVSSTIPPTDDRWVPIVDVNGNYFIARWTENGWNYRDLNGLNTPDNNAKIVGWFSPAVIFMQNEVDDTAPVPLTTIEPDRYFMDTDQNGHWFIIPEKFRNEWREWSEIPEEDERSWVPYLHAIPINGDPTTATFCFPKTK